MAITQVSNSLVKQDLTISGGTVDNTVIGSGTPAAGTFTTITGTLASAVTGTTAAASDNSTKIATTAYVTTAIANLVDTAPSALNTLNELAAALGDDANFATTVNSSIAAKVALSGSGQTILDSADFEIDAGGNILLDADGGGIYFQDGSTLIGSLQNSSSDYVVASEVADKDIIFKGIDGSSTITALTLDMSAAGLAVFNAGATFAGIGGVNNIANDLTIFSTASGHNGLRFHVNGILPTDNAGAIVDNDADLGDPSYRFKDLYLSGSIKNSSNITLDAAGDIHLDADSEAIRIRHDGGDIGIIQMTSNDLILRSMVSDKDLIFKGNDGGSVITALTLDMSEAGAAKFTGKVNAGGTTMSELLNVQTGSSSATAMVEFRNTQAGTQIGMPANTNALVLQTADTARVTIDSSGNVGIGTSSPGSTLHVDKSNIGSALVTFHQTAGNSSADRGLDVETSSTGTTVQRWLNSGSELMRVVGDGKLLIGKTGTNFATAGVRIDPTNIQITASGAEAGYFNRLSNDGLVLVFYQDTAQIGGISVKSDDLVIHSTLTNHVGLSFGNTRIEPTNNYGTTSNNTVDLGNTDRKFKNFYLQGTAYLSGRASSIGTATLAGYAQPSVTLIETQNTTTGTTHYAAIFRKNDTSSAGSIQVSNTATAYVTSSDYRLKENVVSLENGLERVKKLKPVKFNWVDDSTETEGFIAHEIVEAGWSEGVLGEKDAVDEEGNIEPQQVDYGRITPLLVKAIQEQQELIEALQAEVAALKGE